MINKVYQVTKEQLQGHANAQLRIDRNDGSIVVGPGRNGAAGTVLVRHGLRGELEYYAATLTEHGLLIAISNGISTRFYVLAKNFRETLVVDSPSRSHEESWKVFFTYLLSGSHYRSVMLYNTWHTLLLQHYLKEGLGVELTVEGKWRNTEFVASLEWNPERPGAWEVSTTFDDKVRQMPLAYHPIEAIHRVTANK